MQLNLQNQVFHSPKALCKAAHSWASAQAPPVKAATVGSVPPGTPRRHPFGPVYELPLSKHAANVQSVAHVQPCTPVQLEKVHRVTGCAPHICGVCNSSSSNSASNNSSSSSNSSSSHTALSIQPRSAFHMTHKIVSRADDPDEWSEDLLFSENDGEARNPHISGCADR